MPPVVDQGELGSCTANAIVRGLREYLLLQSGRPFERLSRLYLYWHERQVEGTVGQDAGASLRDGMKLLQKLGVCRSKLWPYTEDFRKKPDDAAEADAIHFRISEYHRVAGLNHLKAALAQGWPVVFGMLIYESFEGPGPVATGVIDVPDVAREQLLGGHALCAAGYDDAQQMVIVRNSWGTDWGKDGYCFIPYAIFQNPALLMDMWTGSADS
ncbi:C1 family peptidase [Ferviditalea candida]|uniref:C1 family peptidase n=1 Tax=Ferviditalea candida TaxID=3108399 RepID=A0ABU5ZQI0_9BACL|nr:C1 family peptidase [Paenibacillaceae bacterium T2]